MSGGPSEETLKEARDWCIREMNARRVPGQHPSHMSAKILKEADAKFALDSFGVEGWADAVGNRGVEYLNMGDTYALTLIAKTSRSDWSFHVGCWGDFAP